MKKVFQNISLAFWNQRKCMGCVLDVLFGLCATARLGAFLTEAASTNQHLLHGITVINGLKAINKPPTAGVYILKVVLRVRRQ